jgi:hypothetical protein
LPMWGDTAKGIGKLSSVQSYVKRRDSYRVLDVVGIRMGATVDVCCVAEVEGARTLIVDCTTVEVGPWLVDVEVLGPPPPVAHVPSLRH